MDFKTIIEQLKEKRNTNANTPTTNNVDLEKLAAFKEKIAKLREKAKERANAEK